MVEQLTLLFHIWKVLGSNLGLELVILIEVCGFPQSLILGPDHFLPNPF
jgi:hypothetical protein